MKRHLTVWAQGINPPEVVPRLTLADLLYSPPNPDMTRKRCGNCALWLGARGDGGEIVKEECFIHASDVVVVEDMVCGYHVYGVPMGAEVVPPREAMQPVTPELSGLCQPLDGSSCEVCRYFSPSMQRSGTCAVAFEEDLDHEGDPIHAVVQVNGCCAAWVACDE